MNIEYLRRNTRSYNQRQNDLQESAARLTLSTCRIKVNNTGEGTANFKFACKYSQVPTITFGYEEQSEVRKGYSPLYSASVIAYETIDRPPHLQLYTGATIRIVAEAVEGASFVVIATASGIAFSGPTEGRQE